MGNLILLFVNLRKPNNQSLLEARPGLAVDIWKTLPHFPISDDCSGAVGMLPWADRDGQSLWRGGLLYRPSQQGPEHLRKSTLDGQTDL